MEEEGGERVRGRRVRYVGRRGRDGERESKRCSGSREDAGLRQQRDGCDGERERRRDRQTDGKEGRQGRGGVGVETPPIPPPPVVAANLLPGAQFPGVPGSLWYGEGRGHTPGGGIWPGPLDTPFPTSEAAPQELLRPRERPWAQQRPWDNSRGTATEGTAKPSEGPLPAKRSLPNLPPPPEPSRSGLAPDAMGGSCRGLPASGAVGSVCLRRWYSSLHGPVPLPGLQHCLQAWRLGSGPSTD